MTTPLPAPPRAQSLLTSRLRADLLASGWDEDFEQTLPVPALQALKRGQPLLASKHLRDEDDPATLLFRLFKLGEDLTPEQIGKAFPTLSLQGALGLRLIRPVEVDVLWNCTGEEADAISGWRAFTANIDLTPVDLGRPGWIASDRSPAQTGRASYPEQILGVSRATETLSNLIPEGPSEEGATALDLGCGSGFLAIKMASSGYKVVATDISGRACQFTTFNTVLNALVPGKNVEVRQGSMFEPVSGDSFDLIVSNPPFVLDPRQEIPDSDFAPTRNATGETGGTAGEGAKRPGRDPSELFSYRDGGLGATLMGSVVEGVFTHLTDEGSAVALGNWIVDDALEWDQRPLKWLEEGTSARRKAKGGGFLANAYVVQRDLLDVGQYTEWWLRDEFGPFPTKRAWDGEYDAWIEGFAALGITDLGVGFIAVQLAPTDGPATLQVDTQFALAATPFDAEAVRVGLNADLWVEDWEERPFTRLEGAIEERTYIPGEEHPAALVLKGVGAGSFAVPVTAAVSAFVGVCDGNIRPEQVIPAIAHLLGEDEDEVANQIWAALPTLLRARVLTVAEEPV